MKKCWIYCGLKHERSLAKMGKYRNILKRHAVEKGYKIVSMTSETIMTEFMQTTGALEVINAIKEKQMDVLVIPTEILDKEKRAIQDFILFAKEHGVEIDEIDVIAIGGMS